MSEEKNTSVPKEIIDKAVEELKEYGIRIDSIPEIYLSDIGAEEDLKKINEGVVNSRGGLYSNYTGKIILYEKTLKLEIMNETYQKKDEADTFSEFKQIIQDDFSSYKNFLNCGYNLESIFPLSLFLVSRVQEDLFSEVVSAAFVDEFDAIKAICNRKKENKDNENMEIYEEILKNYEDSLKRKFQHELIHHSRFTDNGIIKEQRQIRNYANSLKNYYKEFLRITEFETDENAAEKETENAMMCDLFNFINKALAYKYCRKETEKFYEKEGKKIIRKKELIGKTQLNNLADNFYTLEKEVAAFDSECADYHNKLSSIILQSKLFCEKAENFQSKIFNSKIFSKEKELRKKGIFESFSYFWDMYNEGIDSNSFSKKAEILKEHYDDIDGSNYSEMFENLYLLRNQIKGNTGFSDKQIMQTIMPFMYHVDVQLNEGEKGIKDSTIHRLNNSENEFNEFLELAKKQEDKTKVAEIWCGSHKLQKSD